MIPNPYERKQNPESVILDILSRKPGITPKELYEFFLDKYQAGMSIQGFYKIVKKLHSDRVIAKTDGRLALYSAWVQNLVQFANQAQESYLDNVPAAVTIILEEGETKEFKFESPVEMMNFWDHSLLTIAYYCRDKYPYLDRNAYSKNFYSWVQLLLRGEEAELINLYDGLDMNWYMASGSSSFLNKMALSQLSVPNFNTMFYKKLTGYGEGRNNFHVTVIGDFVFETQLPNFVFEIIKKAFDTTKGLTDANLPRLQSLIHENARTVLKISRDKKRAEGIRSHIKSLFS